MSVKIEKEIEIESNLDKELPKFQSSVKIKKEKFNKKCFSCRKFYTNETDFKNHDCSATCNICNKKLATKYVLNNHNKRFHVAELDLKFIQCDFCGLKIRENMKTKMIRHMKLKHTDGKKDPIFECDFDGKIYKTKSSLQLHMMRNHQSKKNCKICGVLMKDFYYHNKFCHSKKDGNFQCQNCGLTFFNKEKFKYHQKIHNKQFECQFCDKKFSFLADLKNHKIIHINPKAYQCQICFLNLKTRSNMLYHMKTHDKNRPKSFKCDQCDFSTAHKISLKNHLKIHGTRTLNFKCSECNFKTTHEGNLSRHKEIHNSNRRKFPCLYCNYETTTRTSLKNHLNNRHNPNRIKDFKCTKCNYKTDWKPSLKIHLLTHENRPKKFQCKKCEYSTNREKVFKAHSKLHETVGKIKFKCELCGYLTNNNDHVRRHKAFHKRKDEKKN
ncbi:hypothetical protein PVAND_017069 [Polypedilum vanderplanki]|uniref:C2H2-type domain-containing protein n=1 Tax=Polypedilum vanderplanki TaxID=319348 RepID=A0A9J6BHY4_POLVA|nr:hypothetical protein PVAND_017069 [Polypedilum vanderplanki]